MSQMINKRTGQGWIDDTNVKIHHSHADMMDAIKKLGAMEDLIKESMKSPIYTFDEIKQARRATKDKITKLNEELEKYDNMIEKIDSLPFKEGDAVFHPDHGNVLIGGICINDSFENSTYSITLKTGKRAQVPFNSVMAITDATKILYSKK